MKNLFQNLVWPAAAGNVAWALVTLAITEPWKETNVLPRLVVLLLLAVYLTVGWLRIPTEPRPGYWIADFIHILTIIVFAIATQLNKSWLECSLFSIFTVTTAGHLLGAWVTTRDRFWLAGGNALGMVVLFISHWWFTNPYPWNLPAAIGVVLVAWGIIRSVIAKRGIA